MVDVADAGGCKDEATCGAERWREEVGGEKRGWEEGRERRGIKGKYSKPQTQTNISHDKLNQTMHYFPTPNTTDAAPSPSLYNV